MDDRAHIMVYGNGNFFFAIVPEIPSPKHHEIQEFGQNYHISAMEFSNFTHSTDMLQLHYNILVLK
jgi:hypothetical protein